MIFFDLDGTLIDSNGIWRQIDEDFVMRRGLTLTDEYTDVVCHSTFPVSARFTRDYYHLEESPQAIMDEWESMAYEAYACTIPLKQGAKALLEQLQAEGERLVLLTASLPALCRAALARHGLNPYFEALFFAQEAGLEKRDPALYLLAAQQFCVSPGDCILLEDSPYNCAAAQKAGLQVIGVYDDFYSDQWKMLVQNSHRAVRSLTELLKS